MSDISAIAGQLMSYRTLADGSLRITIDLPQTESSHFHGLFPEVHREIAIAPLRPSQVEKLLEQDFGAYANELYKSINFFGNPEVWRAAGSDDEFLAFVRRQKCIARSGVPHDGPIQAAHVWRLKDGFGKGIKGPYAAVPLCAGHHRAQHQHGEDAIGGREYMEKCRYSTVRDFVWSAMKDDIGVASMRDADPRKVLAWAQTKGVERYLPASLREAA